MACYYLLTSLITPLTPYHTTLLLFALIFTNPTTSPPTTLHPPGGVLLFALLFTNPTSSPLPHSTHQVACYYLLYYLLTPTNPTTSPITSPHLYSTHQVASCYLPYYLLTPLLAPPPTLHPPGGVLLFALLFTNPHIHSTHQVAFCYLPITPCYT